MSWRISGIDLTRAVGPGLALLALILAACGAPRPTAAEERIAETLRILESAPPETLHGRLLSRRMRSFATFDDVLADAAAARVVYLGQTHPVAAHHAFGERLFRGMLDHDPRLALGLEMFPRTRQSDLDAFGAGEIDETELAGRTGCAERWGDAWTLAAPLLRRARAVGIPIVGLDLDPVLARRIGREGLEALPAEVRSGLPEVRRPAVDRDRLAATHGLELPRDADRLRRLGEAMATRDGVMAESIVRFLGSPAGVGRRMIVLCGSGHVRDGAGVPRRVADHHVGPQLAVVGHELGSTWSAGERRALVAGDTADYILLTSREHRP